MDKNPQVFISYSWSNPEHEKKVIELAERLVSHGVMVVFDKWILKEGHDKYDFMEQSVKNEKIDKVLLLCDRTYTEKANSRKGGVGDETMIISPEIYNKVNQEKFIPIVFEKNEQQIPYLPAYLKSKIYIDLSEELTYETEYEKLLRNIHQKPLYKQPPLGSIPEWLNDETIPLSPLKGSLKQLQNCDSNNKRKMEILRENFMDKLITTLEEYKIEDGTKLNRDLVIKKITELKPIRDIYIEYLTILFTYNIEISDYIVASLEKLYNNLKKYEYYNFFIWEVFLCSTTFLFNYERFQELNKVLTTTYFLKEYETGSATKPNIYISFRKYFELIESYTPQQNESKLYTYAGNLLLQREFKPVITKQSLVFSDILLCQLSYIYFSDNKNLGQFWWFPSLYVYNDGYNTYWEKLKSINFCKKILPLFGVITIEELKNIISKHPIDTHHMRYSSSFNDCPQILPNYMKIDDIGTLN